MLRSIQTVTRAGLRVNEDAVGAGEDFLFVIDGATNLSGRNYMDTQSDARWFALQTAGLLREMLANEKGTLSDLVRGAMERVLHQWTGPKEAMPTASAAIWRCRGDKVELFQLGDCGASLERADGSVLVWRERFLARLDEAALEQMTAHREQTGCTMEEARRWATPILQKHRAMHNRPDGYWVLDPTGAGIAHARTAELPAGECRSICAYSDGFAQLMQFVPQWDGAALHRQVMEQGAQALLDRLYDMQEQDREMLRVPRFKLRDDTTAAAAEIEQR